MKKEPQWYDFFKVDGEFAIRNLTIFITIMGATYAVLYMAGMGTLTDATLGVYLFAGAGVYYGGKREDENTKRAKIKADAEPQSINVEKAETVKTQEGDVNVSSSN